MNENGEKIELEGEVTEALRGRMFRVQLDNGHETLGYLAGRLKRYRIRVMLGDRFRSQAIATCAVVALYPRATSSSARPPTLRSGKYGTNTIPCAAQ